MSAWNLSTSPSELSFIKLKKGLRFEELTHIAKSALFEIRQSKFASTSSWLLNGEVQGRERKISGIRPSVFSRNVSACFQASNSGESSAASSAGRKNGTSAPYLNEISAISEESVETITRSILLLLNACSIDQAINGFPANSLIFLFTTPFEPDLAKINAVTFPNMIPHYYLAKELSTLFCLTLRMQVLFPESVQL